MLSSVCSFGMYTTVLKFESSNKFVCKIKKVKVVKPSMEFQARVCTQTTSHFSYIQNMYYERYLYFESLVQVSSFI